MDIFENLENLNVSEECFEDIIGIVEEYINEVSVNLVKKAAANSLPAREKAYDAVAPDDTLPDYNRFPKYDKIKSRYDKAEKLANLLPDSKRNFMKLHKAAKKVTGRRSEEAEDAYAFNKGAKAQERANKRYDKAVGLAIGGPKGLVEDLETLTSDKYGNRSSKFQKAKELGDQAYNQAQDYFSAKGANHDLSTKNDKGIEKFNDNREQQAEKREAGRNEFLKKNISSLLNKRGGLIPKQITKETSFYKPNTNLDPNNSESGLSKAKKRNENKKKK